MNLDKIAHVFGKYTGFQTSPGAQIIYNVLMALLILPFAIISFIHPLTQPIGAVLTAAMIFFLSFVVIGGVRILNKQLQKVTTDHIFKFSSVIGLLMIIYTVFSFLAVSVMGPHVGLPVIILVGILIFFVFFNPFTNPNTRSR